MMEKTGADVIIPTKCNDNNLIEMIEVLRRDSSVYDIVVVADGDETFARITPKLDSSVHITKVELSIGLHTMWNLGMNIVQENNRHVAIINDDVSLEEGAVGIVAAMLDADPKLGLVSPSDDANFKDHLQVLSFFPGYCMVLAADLAREWRFDENMKWWYGDNDVINWVSKVAKRITGKTGNTHAVGNKSHTINNYPPPNFQKDIDNDRLIYLSKWR